MTNDTVARLKALRLHGMRFSARGLVIGPRAFGMLGAARGWSGLDPLCCAEGGVDTCIETPVHTVPLWVISDV